MRRTPIPDSGELDPFGEGAHLVVERDKPRRFYLVEEPPESDDSEDEDSDDDDDEDEDDDEEDDEADEEEDAEDEAEDDEAGGEEGGEKEDDEPDKEASFRRFGRGRVRAREVGPGSIHTAKWDRCTKKVRARGGPYNEYAVCTASVGYEGSIKAGHRRKGKTKEADALDHELQAIYRESARGTFEEASSPFMELNTCHGPGPGHPCQPGEGGKKGDHRHPIEHPQSGQFRSKEQKGRAAAAGTFGRDEFGGGGVRGTQKRTELARHIKTERQKVRSKHSAGDFAGQVARQGITGATGAKRLAQSHSAARAARLEKHRGARIERHKAKVRKWSRTSAVGAARSYNAPRGR